MTKVKMSEKESNKWSLAHGLPGMYAGLLPPSPSLSDFHPQRGGLQFSSQNIVLSCCVLGICSA